MDGRFNKSKTIKGTRKYHNFKPIIGNTDVLHVQMLSSDTTYSELKCIV